MHSDNDEIKTTKNYGENTEKQPLLGMTPMLLVNYIILLMGILIILFRLLFELNYNML